jgi:hypothetical protein
MAPLRAGAAAAAATVVLAAILELFGCCAATAAASAAATDVITAAAELDRIDRLPGQPPVNFSMYSGYVTVDATLLPKIKEATKIQHYRPICLLNGLYKIITKVLTSRIEPYAQKLISEHQTAFIKGRNIMTGVMILHEILHETKKRKEVGVILKLDFEKAYDKVNWDFLFLCLQNRGFGKKWLMWMHMVVEGGTVSVRINNQIGNYIRSAKGVRQGDPLSPILFNFVADSLARMVDKAIENDVLKGLGNHLIPHGVSLLQYADDTIICLENDIKKARNLKMLLYIYEMMAGLKINFMKSEIFVINGDDDIAMQYANLFNCQIGSFPMMYLGVPVSPNRLHIADWRNLEEKLEKRLDSWKGSSLSVAGRITLINACLSNSPIYHMSMYLLPKTTIDNLDKRRKKFLWQGGGDKKKYHLVRWDKVCTSKKKVGLELRT